MFRNFKTNTEYFKNSFFPYCVEEWNKLGPELKDSVSISKFKKSLLAFIRPNMSPVYKINDPLGLKLLTRLRVNFSHLKEHKFRHNFLDTINSLCSYVVLKLSLQITISCAVPFIPAYGRHSLTILRQ